MTSKPDPNPAEAEIRARIRRHGKITFAEFMNLALYHPTGGYYAKAPEIGAQGDFFTSPGAHPVFGALLAVLLARMRESLGKPSPFWVVELGAGDGLLAHDILDYLKRLGFAERDFRYVSVDVAMRGDRRSLSDGVVSPRVPFRGLTGCVLSNELLDAFPVHRFHVKGGRPYEVYVRLDDQGRLTEALDTPSSPDLSEVLDSLPPNMPDGFRGEVNLAICPWLNEVSQALARGFVLTIDYGYEAQKHDASLRPSGTLQTYFHHVFAGSPYQRVGRQDITAHVDFAAVMSEGERYGLRPLALLSQADFLRRLGLDALIARMRSEALPAQEREANLAGMRALAKPGGLGDFKVLIQEKATGVGDAADLLSQDGLLAQDLTASLPLPLLDPAHTSLLEGGYPHAAWQPDSFWQEDEEASGR